MNTQITGFWNKNKVFILGLLSAIVIAIQAFIGKADADLKVLGFAVFMAIVSFFAKEWRGQGLTITGLIGSAATVYLTMQQAHRFSWSQLILQTIVLIITTAVPDPKSRGYENSSVIVNAKRQGEVINPSSLTSK